MPELTGAAYAVGNICATGRLRVNKTDAQKIAERRSEENMIRSPYRFFNFVGANSPAAGVAATIGEKPQAT